MITVLLPARDAARSLGAALESLRAQTLPPHRVVVIDDGSTDSTPALLNDLRWPALRVLRTPGVGIARALNLGLSTISEGFVARMDADDVCHPQRLERQLAHLGPDLDLVGCEVSYS